MSDDGSTKEDVKLPDSEVGEKVKKLFQEDGKDTSMFQPYVFSLSMPTNHHQMSLFSLPWAKKLPSTPRKPQNKCTITKYQFWVSASWRLMGW
jgi:Eukaryotic elongation factor 5A hypusine, DNA-binding OB fold